MKLEQQSSRALRFQLMIYFLQQFKTIWNRSLTLIFIAFACDVKSFAIVFFFFFFSIANLDELKKFVSVLFFCFCSRHVSKFCEWEHDMPGAFQINSNSRFKQACRILLKTEKVTSPLPQYLWPPNLTGWWLTLKGS